jgi:hypothetical protein
MQNVGTSESGITDTFLRTVINNPVEVSILILTLTISNKITEKGWLGTEKI